MKTLIMKVLAVLTLSAALGACSMGGAGGGSLSADPNPPTQQAPSLDAVIGMLPTDDTATNDASITLSWNAVSEATGYEVQLAATEAGVPTAAVESVATTSFDPPSASTHFWYWRVRAVDGDQFGPWSTISSLAVGWNSATIPNPTVFGVDATTNLTDDTTPTFQWDPVPGAVSYELSLPSVNQTISVSEPTYTLDTPLPNDTTYTWNVRAVRTVDGAESFTTATPDATFTVAWGPNGPADGFRFAEELVYLSTAISDPNRRSEFAAGSYRLGGDIDMTPAVSGIASWTPIGDRIFQPFTGTFDGAGYTITGLTIEGGTSDAQGFFGAVDGGHITNLTLRDVNIEGHRFVGGLAGRVRLNGTVSGSSVTGQVNGNLAVGGLVGTVTNDSTVSDSYADVAVTGQAAVGGLMGTVANDSAVSGSYATGTVSVHIGVGTRAGGLVGVVSSRSTVSDSYATATTSSKSNAGGLVGWLEGGTVSRSYATGSVSSQDNERGGLVGTVEGSNNTVSDSFYDQTTTGQSDDTGKGVPKTTADMQNQATFTNWDFTTIWAIDQTINNGYPYLRAFPSQ